MENVFAGTPALGDLNNTIDLGSVVNLEYHKRKCDVVNSLV